MVFCEVYGCPNSCTSIKKDGKPIHFFLFPKTDEIRNEWIEFCGKKEINSKMPRICSDHFYPHLINFKTKRVFLEKGVIPTLNLPVKKPLNHLKKKRKKNKGAAANTNNYHPSSDCSEIRTDVNGEKKIFEHRVIDEKIITTPNNVKLEEITVAVTEKIIDQKYSLILESHHPSVDQRYVADKFDFLSMPDFILYIKKSGIVKEPWYSLETDDVLHILKVDMVQGTTCPMTTADFTINKSTAQCAFHRKGCRVPLSRITKVHIDENGIIRRTQHSIDSVIQSLVDKPQEPMIFNDYINMAKDLIHEASLTDVKYNKVLKFINEQLAMASGSAHSYSPSVIKLGMLLKSYSPSGYDTLRASEFLILPCDRLLRSRKDGITLKEIEDIRRMAKKKKKKSPVKQVLHHIETTVPPAVAQEYVQDGIHEYAVKEVITFNIGS
ncbi:uncharacterized protein [Lepeophtheirus salmonis]|uniref:uncharacterized protein n=1 Tax=Lepeophtheirus salmonis TaxID=72036 RepID=UPI001AE6FEDC|nr:uncharacterized protein LOC121115220 [Lepeophtheirus salmonis]